ncbi:MAG: YkgJ family cysteine cluster protein [Planctomycetaceae bacterium]
MDDQPLQTELRIYTGEDRTPCSDCRAGCCRSFVVPLTGPDVIRIQRDYGLSFWDFVARWDDPTGEVSRGVTPHFRFEDLPQNRFVIGLLHKTSEAFPTATRCRFLSESVDGEAGGCASAKCSIYAGRPLTCRIVPARLDADGEVGGREVPEFGRPESHEAYRLCPRVWDRDDFDPQQIRRELSQITDEMQQLHLVAECWNRKLRPWTSLPTFLQLLYAADVQNTVRRAA